MTDKGNPEHLAEATLLSYARIHQTYDTKFKEAAERILLQRTTRSLYDADVGYHKVECYVNFRSKHWEALEENKEEVHCESNLTSSKDYLQSIIELIRLHVIARKEVYTLTDIRKAYEIIKTDSSPKLRVGDIKAIIVEEFENEILVQEGCYQNKKNEYVFPASFTLTSDVLEAAAKGYGISKTASIRSTANRLHYSLISSQKNRPWPPTPQDIIKDKDPYQIDLFNFIAWLVDPCWQG